MLNSALLDVRVSIYMYVPNGTDKSEADKNYRQIPGKRLASFTKPKLTHLQLVLYAIRVIVMTFIQMCTSLL